MSSNNTNRAMRATKAGQSVWSRASAAGWSCWAIAPVTAIVVVLAWFAPEGAQASQRSAPAAAQAASGGGWGGCSVWCAEPPQRKAPPRTKKSFSTGPDNAGIKESTVKTYIGTKIIKARPATRGECEELLGRQLGDSSTSLADAGYLVEYEGGYQAWSPSEPFERAYREISADEADIERSIQANGLTADRVTPQRISELMAQVVFKTAEPVGTSTFVHAFLDDRFFLGTGHSACVNSANFNAEIGERIARSNAERIARDKLWELEGYVLYVSTAGVPTEETLRSMGGADFARAVASLTDEQRGALLDNDSPLESGEAEAVIPERFARVA